MPKATDAHTTSPDLSPAGTAATAPQELSGDHLLFALATAYRAAGAAGEAGETEQAEWAGSMCNYLDGDAHYERRDVLLEAICMIPATGLDGAMIQIQALALLWQKIA